MLELRKAIARAYANRLPVLFSIEYKPFEFNAVLSQMDEESRKGFGKRAHHEKEEDIEDFQVLAGYADVTGLMTHQDACMFLESNDLCEEVEEMVEATRSMGISSIPLTVVDNKWSIMGAQSSEVYYQIFVKLSEGNGL
ncbi:hypothetical protein FRC06_008066 [Ceratobasidium sp. 370]|nr:hypothetical protein FRC06_008066 [Ceratobasidium sp. 370]